MHGGCKMDLEAAHSEGKMGRGVSRVSLRATNDLTPDTSTTHICHANENVSRSVRFQLKLHLFPTNMQVIEVWARTAAD